LLEEGEQRRQRLGGADRLRVLWPAIGEVGEGAGRVLASLINDSIRH